MRLKSILLSGYKNIRNGAISLPWVTRVTRTLGTSNIGWNGYTFRQLHPAGSFVAASSIRFSFSVPPAATARVDKMYVQEASGAAPSIDFTGTPVPVTYLGATSFTVPAGINSLTTDEIFCAISGSNNILLSVYFTAGGTSSDIMSDLDLGSLVNRGYYKIGDEAALVTVTGFSTSATKYFVSKVETR